MAKKTNINLRSKAIYQVFTRNHTQSGTFQALIQDLPRIAAMGIDIIYLLPIHPSGLLHRKGDMGSPYAIKDYYTIDPAYGTIADFHELLRQIHHLDMKCMMDIVINHTAPDHDLTNTHPEYYYQKADGLRGNKVGDWTDIIDLDYSNKDLHEEMINMLVYWANQGVDGFRCDVASFIPLKFWKKAKKTIAAINPDFIWLAESVHREFLRYYRNQGYMAHSDGEIYQAFDITYDYDIHTEWMEFMKGNTTIYDFAKTLQLQDSIYPANYVKLHFLENHDQPRIHQLTQDKNLTRNWVAFSFFQKGAAFVYAGQEAWATHQPSLFTKDRIAIEQADPSYQSFIKSLTTIKHYPLITDHIKYEVKALHPAIMQVSYENAEQLLLGLFRLDKGNDEAFVVEVDVEYDIPSGNYDDQLTGNAIQVEQGKLVVAHDPCILLVKKEK